MRNILSMMGAALLAVLLVSAGHAETQVYQGRILETEHARYDMESLGTEALLEIFETGEGLMFFGSERLELGDVSDASGVWTLVRQDGRSLEAVRGGLRLLMERMEAQAYRCTRVLYGGMTVRPADLGMSNAELLLCPGGEGRLRDLQTGESMPLKWTEHQEGIQLEVHQETVLLTADADGALQLPLDETGTMAVFEKDAPLTSAHFTGDSPEVWVLFGPDMPDGEASARIMVLMNGENEITWIDDERTSAGHIRNGILTLEEGRSFSVRFEEGEMLLDTDAGADEPMIFERLVDAFDLDFPFEYEE